MADSKKEMVNDLYNAALFTIGAVGVSMASKKVLGEPLSTPTSLQGTAKLAAAVGLSTLGVKYLQGKGYIPKELQK
jgi:hypothetical protein